MRVKKLVIFYDWLLKHDRHIHTCTFMQHRYTIDINAVRMRGVKSVWPLTYTHKSSECVFSWLFNITLLSLKMKFYLNILKMLCLSKNNLYLILTLPNLFLCVNLYLSPYVHKCTNFTLTGTHSQSSTEISHSDRIINKAPCQEGC